MTTKKKTLTLKPIIDFTDKLKKEDEIISVSIDNSGINTLIIHCEPEYRTEDGMFAAIKSAKPKDYTFIRHDLNGNEISTTVIQSEYFNFHHVNYLPTEEILLICGRSRYKSESDIDNNARIYNLNGELVREFIAGDGIEDVKVDLQGNIWTSYFDEGIFGNYGWHDPIGYSGLICWNDKGEKIWEFEAPDGLEHMADCYAMNIDSDNNTWFYYYTEFPLVKLTTSKQIEFWETNVGGSSSLNISGSNILMDNGYDKSNFVLFEVKENKLKKLRKIKFQNEDKVKLNKTNYISSFGSNLGFLEENKIYLTNIDNME